jgi:Ca2+-binding EF-hand superfamily protein
MKIDLTEFVLFEAMRTNKISTEDVARLKEIFSELDREKDGYINYGELCESIYL